MPKGQIFVSNGDGYDNFVTLNDLNEAGNPIVQGWNRKRINATERQVPATVELDGSNFANVRWYAERTDDANTNDTGTETPPENGEIFVSAR